MLKAVNCIGRIGLALIRHFYPSVCLQQFNRRPRFYRYGKSEVFHVRERKKQLRPTGQKLLWFKIRFKEKGRSEKVSKRHIQPLTHFVNNANVDRGVGAIYHITYGGSWYTASHIQLVLRHFPLSQKLLQPLTDRFVQFHKRLTSI